MIPIIEKLKKDSDKFIKVELTRIGGEVKFINDIDTTVDSMVGSAIDFMMKKMEPAILQNTTLASDTNMISSLVSNALNKALDNELITGISDIVNSRPGNLFAKITGLPDVSNLITSLSNRVSSTVQSNLGDIGRGAFDYAEDVAKDLVSPVDRIYNRVFNLAGLSIAQSPSMIGTFATKSMESLINSGGEINAVFSEFNDLCQTVGDNCTAIDGSYYAVDHFQKARNSRAYLELADAKLVNIRSSLIYSGVIDEYRYGLAQDDVQAAADEIIDNGGSVNRVQEIIGALDSLELLVVNIEDQYEAIDSRINNAKDYMGEFSDKFNCSGCLIGVMTNVQSEIRSIMNSMDHAVALGKVPVMNEYERLWWMQLLALIEKMNIIPSGVDDYFTNDPDSYISDYNVDVGVPMQAISLSDIGLLRSQLSQLRYWVTKKLGADIPVTQIANLVSQITSDNLSRITDITSAISIAGEFSIPKEKNATEMVELFSEIGMDRASDLFDSGQWGEFFSLSPATSTYLGQLEESITETIADNVASASIDAIAALNTVMLFVKDTKRSRDVLASTFTSYKDFGLNFKVNTEIPSVMEIGSLIDRFFSEFK